MCTNTKKREKLYLQSTSPFPSHAQGWHQCWISSTCLLGSIWGSEEIHREGPSRWTSEVARVTDSSGIGGQGLWQAVALYCWTQNSVVVSPGWSQAALEDLPDVFPEAAVHSGVWRGHPWVSLVGTDAPEFAREIGHSPFWWPGADGGC